MPDRLSALFARLLLHPRALPVLALLYCVPRAAMIACAVTPSSDADWYYGHAAMLAHGLGYLGGHGQPTAFWPVGWPWLLSLAFRVGGVSVWTVGVLNLAASALTGWIMLDLARRWTGSELAARAGLLAFAIYPNAICYVPLALTEVMYTALLTGGIWLLVTRPGGARTVLAGLVFGVATLVKAQTLVIVPVILAIMLWREAGAIRRMPGMVLRGVLVLGAAALVIAPWTLRNHRELHAWVAVSTNGGITLLTGNNDSARGGYTPDDPLVRSIDGMKYSDEVRYDAQARTLAVDWIVSRPLRFVALAPLKVWHLWGPDGEGQWAYETGSWAFRAAPQAFLIVRAINQVWYWLLLAAFAMAPLRIARRRIDWWLVPYAVALFPTIIAVVFSGQSRFHYPAMPFVCLVAGWLLADWIGAAGLRSRRGTRHAV